MSFGGNASTELPLMHDQASQSDVWICMPLLLLLE